MSQLAPPGPKGAAAKGAAATPKPIPAIPAQPEIIPSTGTPAEDKNIEVAKSVLSALEQGQGKKEADFTNLLTDDIEQDGLIHLENMKGKDGAKKFFKAFTAAFPDAKFETTKAVGIGDYAILESVLRATNKGPLGPLPATKRPIAIHIADVFQIRDGKVARAWTFQNGLELQQQLGLFNVPAGPVPASQTLAPAPKAKK
jgi:predicted ester cyclase